MLTRGVATLLLLATQVVAAQTREPQPAFRGQTEAPPPQRESRYKVDVITDKLQGPWALAFLPDGNFLVTERRGVLRTVTPKGEVSEPITGVPPVKVVAAQSFHDVVPDPNFATNRYLYFTYFAPPKGEAAKEWPIEHYYNDVWNKTLAQRRVLDLGAERVSRAKLSADNRRLEDFEVLIEGRVERRIVFARDGSMYVTGADAFRFYDSDLDGTEHTTPHEPDVRRNFTGRVIRINPDGTIPADNPWLGRATVSRETFAHGFKDPEGAALNPTTGELWLVDHGPQGGDEINIVRAGRDYGWPEVSYGVQYDARQADGRKERRHRHGRDADGRRRAADLFLGAVDRSVGHGVLHGQLVSRLARQLVRRRDGGQAPRAARARRRARRRRGKAARGARPARSRSPARPRRRAVRVRRRLVATPESAVASQPAGFVSISEARSG